MIATWNDISSPENTIITSAGRAGKQEAVIIAKR